MMKAFPRQITFVNGVSEGKWIDDGMDLRDYFAAKAMQGLMRYITDMEFNDGSETPIGIANMSYEYADAMLKAREAHG